MSFQSKAIINARNILNSISPQSSISIDFYCNSKTSNISKQAKLDLYPKVSDITYDSTSITPNRFTTTL